MRNTTKKKTKLEIAIRNVLQCAVKRKMQQIFNNIIYCLLLQLVTTATTTNSSKYFTIVFALHSSVAFVTI